MAQHLTNGPGDDGTPQRRTPPFTIEYSYTVDRAKREVEVTQAVVELKVSGDSVVTIGQLIDALTELRTEHGNVFLVSVYGGSFGSETFGKLIFGPVTP